MSDPTNADRAEYAQTGLEAACAVSNRDCDALIRDFLTDLLHYCSANQIDFDNELKSSRIHFEAECAEEGT